ncbi:MAG: hypothetical protein KDC80_12080, partial [Saprospiraceae bacterium]|nr:hypothetical protein [Saprospiraceae bacterium]
RFLLELSLFEEQSVATESDSSSEARRYLCLYEDVWSYARGVTFCPADISSKGDTSISTWTVTLCGAKRAA